ncbi:MAG: hypothetical protein QXL94_01820 [Candidatus Parvarchaeum sp.]
METQSYGIISYHGSTRHIPEFKLNEFVTGSTGGLELGPHFGNLQQAHARLQSISERRAAEAGRGFNVIPEDLSGMNITKVILNIKNPAIFPDAGTWTPGAIATALQVYPKETNLSPNQRKNLISVAQNVNVAPGTRLSEIKNLLIHWGFDGIMYKNKVEASGYSYIPFFSYQIKPVYK